MLCEICKHNEAECVLIRKDETGEDEELYVCKKCREAADGSAPEDDGGNRRPKATIVTQDGNPPPEFIQNFLDAAVGLIEGVAKSGGAPAEAKCRVCGSTWSSIKESGTTGCPDCWSLFAGEIRKEFLSASYGPKHTGKIPERAPDGKPSRAFLEKELKKAVEEQDYLKAAKIRKLLDGTEGETGK